MRAMPAASSLRSFLLLICIMSTALAWRASINITHHRQAKLPLALWWLCQSQGPNCRAGEFPGKRAKHFRSGYRHDLQSLCGPDLGFALSNDLSSLAPGTRMVFDFNRPVIPRRSTTFAK
jgi:hypothetical protein